MKKIDDILNIPCRLHCSTSGLDIVFEGVLTRRETNVIFTGRTEVDEKKLDWRQTYTLHGDIESTPITLLNTSIKSMSSTGYNSAFHYIKFSPSEIIIGRSYGCGENDIKIKKISANIQILNNMFSSQAVDLTPSFSKENPALANYTYPASIDAIDKDGSLSVYQTFGLGWSRNSINIPLIPCIDYTFHSPASIRDGISKIACVRNLFSFFSNFYIPLENLSFSDEQSCEAWCCDASVNLNFTDVIDTTDRPFLITTSDISSNFGEIWVNWNNFYSKKYIPTLFYEIICNKSLRINRFLNFAQAIEIFSNHYRDEEAKQLAVREGWKGKQLPLKYRFKDIITYLNTFLCLNPSEISDLSKILSDERNFFTHYNEKYTIPSAQELFAAGRVLHFMLLALVYRTISLDDSAIKQAARFFSFGSLSNDIKVVLKQVDCTEYDNMYE